MGLDLRDRSLRGAQMAHQFMPRALFEGSQLEGANFAETQLHGANFWLTQLLGADFSEAKLAGAIFDNVKMQGTIGLQAEMPLLGNGPNQHSIAAINWQKEQQNANDILDPQIRHDYLENLQLSEKQPHYSLAELPQAQHALVASAWIKDFCPEANDNKEMEEKLNGAASLLQMENNSEIDKQLGRSAALKQFKSLLCSQPECHTLSEKLAKKDVINCRR